MTRYEERALELLNRYCDSEELRNVSNTSHLMLSVHGVLSAIEAALLESEKALDKQQDELRRLRKVEQAANEGCTPLEEANIRMLVAEGKARKYERDIADAAGELMVDIPEPGSEKSKLLSANILIRNERDKNWNDLCDLRRKHKQILEKLDKIANGDM